jgi:hypothetical protein
MPYIYDGNNTKNGELNFVAINSNADINHNQQTDESANNTINIILYVILIIAFIFFFLRAFGKLL